MEKKYGFRISAILIILITAITWGSSPFGKKGGGQVNKLTDTIVPNSTHTATANVQLLNNRFSVFLLDTTTQVWVQTPADYQQTTIRYPVIYYLGGEYAFSDSIAPDQKEWHVDETLDSLYQLKVSKSIVVYVNTFISDTSAVDQAASFLQSELKPFIDSTYRTSRTKTIITGSGINAALALYTTLKYPQSFNKAGIFSPPSGIYAYLKNRGLNGKGHKGMLFFYEGEDMEDLNELTDQIGMHSSALIYATHHQNPKRRITPMGGWLPEFYFWIMGNGYNYIIKYNR